MNAGSLNGGAFVVDSVVVVGPLSSDPATLTSGSTSTAVTWSNMKEHTSGKEPCVHLSLCKCVLDVNKDDAT